MFEAKNFLDKNKKIGNYKYKDFLIISYHYLMGFKN